MKSTTKIYVAGHTGLVGSAILRRLKLERYENLVCYTHSELDLTDQAATKAMFKSERPEIVVLAAAKVGGIVANDSFPSDFLYINLAIQNSVINAAVETGVKTLIFLGSSCIYPRDCLQPIKEESLLSGPLEETNRAYAIAKIAGVELCWSANKQYGFNYLAVMPANMYGPNDNYENTYSHVIPGLIRRIHEAKSNGDKEVKIWGTGEPRREFLYSDDLADACLFLLTNLNDLSSCLYSEHKPPLVNIGVGQDLTIHELSNIICSIVGFRGKLVFDTSKPDGTPRKLLDVSKMTKFGWKAKWPLKEGINNSYKDFLNYYGTS